MSKSRGIAMKKTFNYAYQAILLLDQTKDKSAWPVLVILATLLS